MSGQNDKISKSVSMTDFNISLGRADFFFFPFPKVGSFASQEFPLLMGFLSLFWVPFKDDKNIWSRDSFLATGRKFQRL